MVIAKPFLFGSLDLHGLRDVLEGERVLFVEVVHEEVGFE